MSIDELPQRIDPEKLNGITELKPGFGYTISKVGSSRKLDVDNNECNDFAVGYPQSNKVVLLRSKEVVMLQAKKNKEGIMLDHKGIMLDSSSSSSSINPPVPAEEGKCSGFFLSISKIIYFSNLFSSCDSLLLLFDNTVNS